MRRGVFVVKFGVIRPKNVEIRCRNGEIRCLNAEIIASYAEIWYSFHCFLVGFRRKYGAKTAKWWCVSGVSNHDFTNFTKHSTVLTSILQQINTLYQHFPSAETAIPALEQVKTMLKIALPTFKNDENHTQNSKIHTQNSVCEVRCGENSVRKRQNVCGVRRFNDWLRHVLSWLRRFLCVFQMIAMFICGENTVRRWQNCGVFAACTCLISCIFVAKVAKWWCDCGGWWCGCGVFVFGFFMI